MAGSGKERSARSDHPPGADLYVGLVIKAFEVRSIVNTILNVAGVAGKVRYIYAMLMQKSLPGRSSDLALTTPSHFEFPKILQPHMARNLTSFYIYRQGIALC